MKQLLIVLVIAVLAGSVFAAIPQQINYQGSLTSISGTALDTTLAITFNIWPVPAGGSPDWTESHSSVTVSDGLFHVLLGSVSPPLPDLFTADRWLGITIGGDSEMSPRQQVVSVAHAYRVGTVDGASGGTITSDVIINSKLNVGSGNTNTGSFANVLGENNLASGDHAIVGGGENNHARGSYSVVAGGGGAIATLDSNSATGVRSAIGGGSRNTSSSDYATVSGGYGNSASSGYTTVSGGSSNTASGNFATVSGGNSNTASFTYATVSGGNDNTASGFYSTVSGGNNNTASSSYTTVSGGYQNVAAGLYSFAAGFRARANHTKSFVWGSSNSGADSTASFSSYTFTARCANGARFYTAQTGTATGVSLPAGGGAWAALCDANQKRFHGDVNSSDILQKISALPLHRWSYKSQNETIQHIGPTAQDFYASFGLGDDNTTISTLDPDGIALAAIQELAKENLKLQTSNNKLEEDVRQLMARVQTLEAGKQKAMLKK